MGARRRPEAEAPGSVAFVGSPAISSIVPQTLRTADVSQPELPAPAAYEVPPVDPGERRQRHPLDSSRDLDAEGKAWAHANGVQHRVGSGLQGDLRAIQEI